MALNDILPSMGESISRLGPIFDSGSASSQTLLWFVGFIFVILFVVNSRQNGIFSIKSALAFGFSALIMIVLLKGTIGSFVSLVLLFVVLATGVRKHRAIHGAYRERRDAITNDFRYFFNYFKNGQNHLANAAKGIPAMAGVIGGLFRKAGKDLIEEDEAITGFAKHEIAITAVTKGEMEQFNKIANIETKESEKAEYLNNFILRVKEQLEKGTLNVDVFMELMDNIVKALGVESRYDILFSTHLRKNVHHAQESVLKIQKYTKWMLLVINWIKFYHLKATGCIEIGRKIKNLVAEEIAELEKAKGPEKDVDKLIQEYKKIIAHVTQVCDGLKEVAKVSVNALSKFRDEVKKLLDLEKNSKEYINQIQENVHQINKLAQDIKHAHKELKDIHNTIKQEKKPGKDEEKTAAQIRIIQAMEHGVAKFYNARIELLKEVNKINDSGVTPLLDDATKTIEYLFDLEQRASFLAESKGNIDNAWFDLGRTYESISKGKTASDMHTYEEKLKDASREMANFEDMRTKLKNQLQHVKSEIYDTKGKIKDSSAKIESDLYKVTVVLKQLTNTFEGLRKEIMRYNVKHAEKANQDLNSAGKHIDLAEGQAKKIRRMTA